nr:TPA_inf: conotoxin precursor A [Conus ebraeus]
MGMRLVFTVFLLVILASTVTLDRASNGMNAAAIRKASALVAQIAYRDCCDDPACTVNNPGLCT